LIERLEFIDRINNSYKFKLLFLTSRDGFSQHRFHDICNYQSRTVTIIKVKESNEILGRYNPIEWKSGHSWGTTKDSFIFSFKKNDRIENHILSRVKDEKKAVLFDHSHGPIFGNGDLTIWNVFSTGSCKKNSYEKQIRETGGYF